MEKYYSILTTLPFAVRLRREVPLRHRWDAVDAGVSVVRVVHCADGPGAERAFARAVRWGLAGVGVGLFERAGVREFLEGFLMVLRGFIVEGFQKV